MAAAQQKDGGCTPTAMRGFIFRTYRPNSSVAMQFMLPGSERRDWVTVLGVRPRVVF